MCGCICCVVQSQCGASYAFSAIAALEGANALATGSLTVLSEQNIVDCSGNHTEYVLPMILTSLLVFESVCSSLW